MNTPRLPRRFLTALLPMALLVAACGDDDDAASTGSTPPASTDAKVTAVSFTEPANGDHIAGSVHVVMSARGLTIEPAGEVHPKAGHFHVIADDGCVAPGAAVPKDAQHVHFGKGQTEGKIYLGPGEHELCLQPGDGQHVALDVSDTVKITVGVESRKEWCGVIKEVDDLFDTTDNSSDEFAVKQAGYGGITRLVAQLLAAMDQVDANVRDQVRTTLEGGQQIAQVFVDAPDATAAAAKLQQRYGTEGVTTDPEAAQWIRDSCNVDVES